MNFELSIRSTLAAAALALAGAAFGQTPAAPAATPATKAATPVPSAGTPAPAAIQPNAPSGVTQERGTRRTTAKDGAVPRKGAAMAQDAAKGGTVDAAAPPAGGRAARAAASKTQRDAKDPAQASARSLQSAYTELMTPEEMAAHRTKVKSLKTYSECKALFEKTGGEMEARAKAQSKTVKSTPAELCDKAKERGRVKG